MPNMMLAKEASMEQEINKWKTKLVEVLGNAENEFVEEKLKELPEKPGIYIIYQNKHSQKQVFYIGQSNNLNERIYLTHYKYAKNYSSLAKKLIKKSIFNNDIAYKKHLEDECSYKFMIIDDVFELNRIEHFAIAALNPLYNDKIS